MIVCDLLHCPMHSLQENPEATSFMEASGSAGCGGGHSVLGNTCDGCPMETVDESREHSNRIEFSFPNGNNRIPRQERPEKQFIVTVKVGTLTTVSFRDLSQKAS